MKNNNPENIEILSKNHFATKLDFWPGRDTYDEIKTTNYIIFLIFIKRN